VALAPTDRESHAENAMLCCKPALFLLLLLPSAAFCTHAQDIVGQWQGTIKTSSPQRVALVVSIDSAAKLQAYFVFVDLRPERLPVASISMANGEIEFSIATIIHGSYRGKLRDDKRRIDGTWVQRSPAPLDFQRATTDTSWLTKSTIRSIAVAPAVSLEVIDWGGSGPPLVFLAGLTYTAHVFDNFAPKFVPKYHAYGITRRGFGASSSPAPISSNYSADQLGDDILKVIDTLGLKRPVLIGHSIAGEELSSIGSRYPDKIAGLVYLDAGYAHALYSPERGDSILDADEMQKDLNTFFPAQSVSAQKEITSKLLAEIPRLQKDLEADQKLLELMPSSAAAQKETESPFADVVTAILKGEQKYANIQAPALVIFAGPHSTSGLPSVPDDKKAEYIATKQTAQTNAFEKLKSAKVLIIPNANHFVFESNEQEVEKDIKNFLDTLKAEGI